MIEMESEVHLSLARSRARKEGQKTSLSLARAEFVGQTAMYFCFDRDLMGLIHFEMDLTHWKMGSAVLTDFDTDLTDFWEVG